MALAHLRFDGARACSAQAYTGTVYYNTDGLMPNAGRARVRALALALHICSGPSGAVARHGVCRQARQQGDTGASLLHAICCLMLQLAVQ